MNMIYFVLSSFSIKKRKSFSTNLMRKHQYMFDNFIRSNKAFTSIAVNLQMYRDIVIFLVILHKVAYNFL